MVVKPARTSPVNRRVAGSGLFVFVGHILLSGGAWTLGLPLAETQVTYLFFWGIVMALMIVFEFTVRAEYTKRGKSLRGVMMGATRPRLDIPRYVEMWRRGHCASNASTQL